MRSHLASAREIDAFFEYWMANIDAFFVPPAQHAEQDPPRELRFILHSCECTVVHGVADEYGAQCTETAAVGDSETGQLYCITCWKFETGEN